MDGLKTTITVFIYEPYKLLNISHNTPKISFWIPHTIILFYTDQAGCLIQRPVVRFTSGILSSIFHILRTWVILMGYDANSFSSIFPPCEAVSLQMSESTAFAKHIIACHLIKVFFITFRDANQFTISPSFNLAVILHKGIVLRQSKIVIQFIIDWDCCIFFYFDSLCVVNACPILLYSSREKIDHQQKLMHSDCSRHSCPTTHPFLPHELAYDRASAIFSVRHFAYSTARYDIEQAALPRSPRVDTSATFP